MSSGHRTCLEQAEEVAGEVALEATDRLAHALALGSPPLDVGDRRRVVLAPRDDDRVQRAVELPVAAGVEPVAKDEAGGGGDRSGAGEAGKGGVAAEAAAVRPREQHLRGGDRADARLVEQRRREPRYQCLDLALELALLGRERLHAASERAQRDQRPRSSSSWCRSGRTSARRRSN